MTSSSFLSSALDEPACMSGGNLEGDVRLLMAIAASSSVFSEDARWDVSSSSKSIARRGCENLNKSLSAPPPSPQ